MSETEDLLYSDQAVRGVDTFHKVGNLPIIPSSNNVVLEAWDIDSRTPLGDRRSFIARRIISILPNPDDPEYRPIITGDTNNEVSLLGSRQSAGNWIISLYWSPVIAGYRPIRRSFGYVVEVSTGNTIAHVTPTALVFNEANGDGAQWVYVTPLYAVSPDGVRFVTPSDTTPAAFLVVPDYDNLSISIEEQSGASASISAGVTSTNRYSANLTVSLGSAVQSQMVGVTLTRNARPTLPAVPTNLMVTDTQRTSLSLSWSGSAPAYDVRYIRSGGVYNTTRVTGTTTTLRALAEDTTYQVSVRAVNGSLLSDYSSAVSGTTTFNPVPTVRVTSTTYDTINIAWNAVPNASSYTVRHRVFPDTEYVTTQTTSTTATVSGLNSGTIVEFQVRASGDYSSVVSGSTLGSRLPAPTGLRVSSTTSNSVTLTWNPSSGATTYTVRYRRVGDSTYTEVTGASPFTIPGLVEDREYEVNVTASNSNEQGITTQDLVITPMGAPTADPPENVVLAASTESVPNPGLNTITIEWNKASKHEVSNFDIRYRLVGGSYTEFNLVGVATRRYTIEGLTPDTGYEIQIRSNVNGLTSTWVTLNVSTPIDTLGLRATDIRILASVAVDLEWNNIDNAGSFNIRYGDTVVTSNTNVVTLNGLDRSTQYTIAVEPVVDGVEGGYYPPIVLNFNRDVGGIPGVAATYIPPSTIRVVANSVASLTEFRWRIQGDTIYQTVNHNNPQYNITDVKRNTVYEVSARAGTHTVINNNVWADSVFVRTRGTGRPDVTPVPTGLVARPAFLTRTTDPRNDLAVTWIPVAGIDSFRVRYREQGETTYTVMEINNCLLYTSPSPRDS